MAKQANLAACLDVLADRTAEGAIHCKAHAAHGAVHLLYQGITRMANVRDIGDAVRALRILVNFATHDPDSLEAELGSGLPALLDALGKLHLENVVQRKGLRLLEQLFKNARTSKRGPNRRVVTLGHGLNEAFTFRVIQHIFKIMQGAALDCDLQEQAIAVLAPLGDALMDGALATDAFALVVVAVRNHMHSVALCTNVVQLIGRLGPVFLAKDRRGIEILVACVARHRSAAALQHVGAQALARLCAGGGDTVALRRCRASGAVTAMVLAMCAHASDKQLHQEATSVLDILCPGAMAIVRTLGPALTAFISPMRWSSDPMRAIDYEPVDLTLLKSSGQFSKLAVESFEKEVLGSQGVRKPGGVDSEELLHFSGYVALAFRDLMSYPWDRWPIVGSGPKLNKPMKDGKLAQEPSENTADLPGPDKKQLAHLCQVLKKSADILPEDAVSLRDGRAGSGDSRRPVPAGATLLQAVDAECLITLLGFFARTSPRMAQDIYNDGAGGAAAICAWLTSRCFSVHNAKNYVAGDDEQVTKAAFPLHRACLSALAALCRHDTVGPPAVLAARGGSAVMDFLGHMDPGVRCAALRCAAWLIKHAGNGGQLGATALWSNIFSALRNTEHDAVRLAAGGCAFAALNDGWAGFDVDPPAPIQGLFAALKVAMMQATQKKSAEGMLPLLLCMKLLLENDMHVRKYRENPEGMLRALPQWVPGGAKRGATSLERALALVSVQVMDKCYERKLVPADIMLDADVTLQLLHSGASEYAEHTLARTCDTVVMQVVSKETQLAELEHLLAVPPKRSNGSNCLPAPEVLHCLLHRTQEIFKSAPEQASESLSSAIAKLETLLVEEGSYTAAEPLILDNVREFKRLLSRASLRKQSQRRRSSHVAWNDVTTAPLIERSHTDPVQAESPIARAQSAKPVVSKQPPPEADEEQEVHNED